MSLPKWFKDFSLIKVNIDLSGLKQIKLLSDNNIGSGVKAEADEHSKTLVVKVDPEHLKNSSKELEEVKKLIKLAVVNEGGIIEEDTEKLIEDVSTFQHDDENVQLLQEVRAKLPAKDVPIWEAAFYIRRVYQQGGHIEGLKRNIKFRFGDRGGNIVNLCTAGYLEEIILPIYNELSSNPDFTIEEFSAQYEVIVTKYPFAVFVAQASPDSAVLEEIKSKIEYNKAYGISSLNIHTIGKDNKRKVLAILDQAEIKQLFSRDPKITSDGDVLQVIVYF